MAQFNVTDLDFDQIKDNIKSYLKAQGQYNDYDFEGSGLSILMDILAYNTHYNAMAAHFSLNEAFLDSAQIRGNLVSHAKLLGYVPRSTVAPLAYVNITVNNPIGSPVPATLTLPRGAKLSTVIDNVQHQFVVLNSVTSYYDQTNNNFKYENIEIRQGVLKKVLKRVDNSIKGQKFIIPDTDVDMSTIRVRVKANENSNDYEIYTRLTDLGNADSESPIYFIQENTSGKYEIYFGDGVVGKKPKSNAIVEIEFIYSNGPATNGARVFTFADTISGNSDISVVTIEPAAGGTVRESVESIRFNAPLTFLSQNRAVTSDDYRSILLKQFGNIEAISVWGGEDQPVPDYGKVFISIKPLNAEILTQVERDRILLELKRKNIVSIIPVLVDPEYTKIKLETFFKYNPNLTDRTQAELESLVGQVIEQYNEDDLKQFDGVFRYSKLSRLIDVSDPGILNSFTRVYMYKDVTAVASRKNEFHLEYASAIYQTDSDEATLTSTPFKINGVDCYFSDEPANGSTDRLIYVYKIVNGETIKVINDAGYIKPSSGEVVLRNFRPDDDTSIRITCSPNSNDLAPKRNQLLMIDVFEVDVAGEVDTIATSGVSGALNYTTTSRHR
jgi:hypothetical protein